MGFDFDRFIISAKLAYRRCYKPVYGLGDVLTVFQYYFNTYEFILGETHPVINLRQITDIINKMPYVLDDVEDEIEITPDDYKEMIDQHFNTVYNRGKCDYNINHFFSGKIRYMRYRETCY